ncbi:hypothetical protein KUTeg_022998 [Tegillarca granosa]|uniref:PiggyBac transposable element-derived protein 4 C-terminal zinc-finger domain-containing protein n=1 Tax=Tegillarca granosa TaxID=220873 RepID=A0ABQ9E0F1_TEGGR|nr:hypothetical protein KUTeg_022998 [Tegillarca granosa]
MNCCFMTLFGKIEFSLLFSEPAWPLDKKFLSERNLPFERGFGAHVGMFGKSNNEKLTQKGVNHPSPTIPDTNYTNISYFNIKELNQGRLIDNISENPPNIRPGNETWNKTETSELLKRLTSKSIIQEETSYIQKPIAMSNLLTPSYGTDHGHKLVLIDENKAKTCKICVYCQTNKVRTKSGWYVYTSYRCEECDVPLCHQKTQRDCFDLYHADISKIMSGGSGIKFEEGNT